MSERSKGPMFSWRTFLLVARGLYVELAILAVCGAIISETGKTSGPVFDVVGPDFIPLSVAYMIIGLTTLQIGMRFLGGAGGPIFVEQSRSRILKADYFWVLGFCVTTGLYVVVLSARVMPYYMATGLFVVATTVILARRVEWRDIWRGAVIGIVLGVVLQTIFTQILVIDLPT